MWENFQMSVNARLLELSGLIMVVTTISACSPLAVLNVLSPSRHYERQRDVAYGDDSRQRLDLYLPSPIPDRAPLVVFFYGGGWTSGAKQDYEFVAASLTEAGLIVAIPDYRLFPDVRFPVFVEDGALAVASSLAYLSNNGTKPSGMYLMGHSAGAHIAAMLAMNEEYLAAHSIETGILDGFIGLSGPYDFLPIEGGYLEEVFPNSNRAASQPINFVSEAAPRTLLIHGSDDTTVNVLNSQKLAAALRERAVDVTLKTYEGVGHIKVMLGLARPLDFTTSTLEDSRAFIFSSL
jgi:acetyl esterase/lipase